MDEQTKEKYLDYVLAFTPPAESNFFTPIIKAVIEAEISKLANTYTFVENVLQSEDFDSKIERAVIDGKIFSPSQYARVAAVADVINQGSGARVDITETLINLSGQRIIMSPRLQNILGFATDGYMLKNEAGELAGALQADGVPGPEIDRVNQTMNKYGAISMQRGIFIELKNYLEESIGRTVTVSKGYIPEQEPAVVIPQNSVKIAEEMPAGFIEFLKNNDKKYDVVEHKIMTDSNFIAFFNNLKQHNGYYKTLPGDRMAHEIILRPVLWSKLQPQLQMEVSSLVENNRKNFQEMVQHVAQTSGYNKLEALKKNLAE